MKTGKLCMIRFDTRKLKNLIKKIILIDLYKNIFILVQ